MKTNFLSTSGINWVVIVLGFYPSGSSLQYSPAKAPGDQHGKDSFDRSGCHGYCNMLTDRYQTRLFKWGVDTPGLNYRLSAGEIRLGISTQRVKIPGVAIFSNICARCSPIANCRVRSH